MPAKSKKQQRFFGMVHARQKGEKVGGPDVAKVAKEIDFDDAEDFASTKHKGLPEKAKDKDKKKKKDKEDKMDESKTLWQQYVERRELTESKPWPVPAGGIPKPPPVPRKKPVDRHPEYQTPDQANHTPDEIRAQEKTYGSRSPFGKLQRKYMGNDVIKVPPHLVARRGQEVEPGTGGDPKQAPHTLLGKDDIVRNPPPHRGPQSLVP